MTIREAILKSLKDLNQPSTAKTVYEHIMLKGYYKSKGKTFDATVSAWLTMLVNDERYTSDEVVRSKKDNIFEYYLPTTNVNQITDAINPFHKSTQLYINQYKGSFDRINALEIYKWKAVKCFQDNWNIEAVDFAEMLTEAFAKASSLLDSGNYFPLRMLRKNTVSSPNKVKQLFSMLYNEELDLKFRIEKFIASFKQINEQNSSGKNAYQDHRAVIVYLCMRYPEEYFLYKFTMFGQFSNLVNYDYTPKRGKIENVFHYINLCEQLKTFVEKDESLQRLHQQRIVNHPDAYAGNSINLLVQDIIYAATFHFKEILPIKTSLPKSIEVILDKSVVEVVASNNKKRTFKGAIINYTAKQKKQKQIGNSGEFFVLQQENKRLHSFNKIAEHVAITQGDGLGYDIKSYDAKGKEIYIEVKTTTQSFGSPFYITRTELERSIKEGDKYYLYRVYNFNMTTGIGKIHIYQGSLERFCQQPENYKVQLRKL